MRIEDLLYHFQTDPAGGGDPGGGAADPTITGEPPTPATDPTPPAAAADQPGWVPSQDEWTQMQQTLQGVGQYAPLLNELAAVLAEPEGQQQQQYDFSTPEGQQAYLDARLEQMFQERFAPIEPVLGQIAEREGEAAARNALDQLAKDGGEFDREGALVAAQAYVNAGYSPQDALQNAAAYQRGLEQRIREAALAEYKTSIENGLGAPANPAVPGAAQQNEPPPTGRDRYEVAARNFFDRRNPIQPVG